MSVFHSSSNSHHSNPALAYTSPGKINLNCTITGDTIPNGSKNLAVILKTSVSVGAAPGL